MGVELPSRWASEPAKAGFVEAARVRGVPLEVVDLDDPEVLAAYERRLVLVRSDGHVAWRSDRPSLNPAAVIDRARGSEIGL